MKYKEYSHHELEVLRESTAGSHAKDKKDVLFGYSHVPAGPCRYGGYGGFSFLLYETGLIEVQEYLFSDILAEERRYCVPEVCVSKVKLLFYKMDDRIQSLYVPDNQSNDGSYSCFFFGKEWLNALNIMYNDDRIIARVREVHPDDFDEWVPIMKAENDILDMFFAVCDILKQYDVILEQYSASVFGEKITGYEDFMKRQ